MASDPSVFHRAGPRIHDVVFVGSRYGIRGRVVERRIGDGIRIMVFGPGWPNGPLRARDVAQLFGTAKIVLGIGTVGNSADIVTMNLRDFDAQMSGALYI